MDVLVVTALVLALLGLAVTGGVLLLRLVR